MSLSLSLMWVSTAERTVNRVHARLKIMTMNALYIYYSNVKIVTVKEAVKSKGEQYWEPNVGKSFKVEVHPLAGAITVISWKQINFEFTSF